MVNYCDNSSPWQVEVKADCPPRPTPPESPLSSQCLMTHPLSWEPSYPLHALDSHPHSFSRATQDSWNVIPAHCPGDSCSQWKKSPCGIQPDWQPLLRKGGNVQGIWWHVALLPHLLPFLPKGGSCLSSEQDISCPRVTGADCTPRCFAGKSRLEKPHRRYSFLTNSCCEETWVGPQGILLNCQTQPNLNLKQI